MSTDIEKARHFYGDLLGFTVSDIADFSGAPWFPKDAGLGDRHGYFMRYGTDHHAMVLFSKPVMDRRADRQFAPEVTINQITWQCGSLKEIVEAYGYFEEQQVRIQRVGRDMPGSNWHTYVYDPDGHTNEFYYGIEQVGWNQESKPRDDVLSRVPRKAGTAADVGGRRDRRGAWKRASTFSPAIARPLPNGGKTYDVDGVLLPRPFKITKIGPVRLFVEDVDRAEAFYTRHLGLTKSEESVYRGARCVFLRTGAEHHSLALYPKELRGVLGLSPHTTCLSFGVELANYAQLREAVAFLKAQGCTLIDLPPELYPGIDYAAFARDPDGHCIQLYYYMEQIGWDGSVRPASERRRVTGEWPQALEPLSDSYVDQVFQGPFG